MSSADIRDALDEATIEAMRRNLFAFLTENDGAELRTVLRMLRERPDDPEYMELYGRIMRNPELRKFIPS